MTHTHKMRWIAAAMSLLMTGALLAGCSSEEPSSSQLEMDPSSAASQPAEKTKVNAFALKGPTGVGMTYLMEANEAGTAANAYTVTLLASPQDAQARILNGEADIAAVPTNLAAVLYNKTGGKVKLLAVNTLGVLHILENGESIHSVADLKGKTIYSTGQGSNPEYVLNYVLEKNGLIPGKDVKIQFVNDNDELATLMATGEAKVAMVPEPSATTVLTKNSTVRAALDMTEEWKKASNDESALMMGCVVVNTDFAAKNPQAVKDFLTEYQSSVEKAAQTEAIDRTAQLCEQFAIIPKAAVAKKALPGCNLYFAAGANMKNQIEGYYQVLFDANPQSVGGKLPDDNFYYQA